MDNRNRTVVTIAWGHQFIEALLNPAEKALGMRFFHVAHHDDVIVLNKNAYYSGRVTEVPTYEDVLEQKPDIALLTSFEEGANFTINNLILSDRILRHRPIDESLRYATFLARMLTNVFSETKPLYVLGSWDSMIQGMSMLVARKMGIPFYIMKFSVIPAKHLAFCEYPNANREIDFTGQDDVMLLKKSTEVLNAWRSKAIVAPAYVSAKTFTDIIRMLPIHLKEMSTRLKRTFFAKGNNKLLYYPTHVMVKQYIRKKTNILRMNKKLFITELPERPFFFYGLHMQPESSVDVMAPFYSDQYNVIEAIARSMPANYLLLVKIHVSDADNYSNAQIRQFLNIPNVRIVSPFVTSRKFVDAAAMIFSITGTIGLEGALLGKQVVMFGDSPILKFPSVSKMTDYEQLPALVAKKLATPVPTDAEIIRAFAHFLKSFLPSCSDNWVVTLTEGLTPEEEQNFIVIFERLNAFVEKQQAGSLTKLESVIF